MGNKRKKRDEMDVETIRETVLATPEGSEPINRKKHEKRKKQTTTETDKLKHKEESNQDETMTVLNKKIDELSTHIKEITYIVKKLEKNSELVAISLKEKETPPAVEHECYFEDEHAFPENEPNIFVRGFDCSFPKVDIKKALEKHFSSSGTVYYVFLPFHCKSGRPLGFAYMHVREPDVKSALALNGSYLGGKRLDVAMARDKGRYYGLDNRQSCERCRPARIKTMLKRFYNPPGFKLKIPLNKEDLEAMANYN